MTEEDNIEGCKEIEKDLFMQNMLAKEALLSALPKIEYGDVKYLRLANEIWNSSQSTFEGNSHAKRARLKSWIYLFQDDKMLEDETI